MASAVDEDIVEESVVQAGSMEIRTVCAIVAVHVGHVGCSAAGAPRLWCRGELLAERHFA